jgi:hypothetical protein
VRACLCGVAVCMATPGACLAGNDDSAEHAEAAVDSDYRLVLGRLLEQLCEVCLFFCLFSVAWMACPRLCFSRGRSPSARPPSHPQLRPQPATPTLSRPSVRSRATYPLCVAHPAAATRSCLHVATSSCTTLPSRRHRDDHWHLEDVTSHPWESESASLTGSDMISCAIEWQPSEAAFSVWPPIGHTVGGGAGTGLWDQPDCGRPPGTKQRNWVSARHGVISNAHLFKRASQFGDSGLFFR